MNRLLWWLADPLYSEPGNERRVEHYRRLVLGTLRSAPNLGERDDWRPAGNGRALSEMVVRYGWPSYAYWGGGFEDDDHYGYLGVKAADIARSYGLFTSFEYRAPRVHSLPNWSAVRNPTQAVEADWDLTAQFDSVPGAADTRWWPTEHMPRDSGVIVGIDASQRAFLRRDTTAILAVAATAPRNGWTPRATMIPTAVFVYSPSPDSIMSWKQLAFRDSTAVAWGVIPATPGIAGLEVVTTPGGWAYRSRFGVAPPPTLAQLWPDTIAVSEPVLIEPAAATDQITPEGALRRMLGSTVLREPRSIGVYWETYGVAAADSVEVAIAITRHNAGNRLQRLGAAIGLTDRKESTVTIRWPRAPTDASIDNDSVACPHSSTRYSARRLASRRGRLYAGGVHDASWWWERNEHPRLSDRREVILPVVTTAERRRDGRHSARLRMWSARPCNFSVRSTRNQSGRSCSASARSIHHSHSSRSRAPIENGR